MNNFKKTASMLAAVLILSSCGGSKPSEEEGSQSYVVITGTQTEEAETEVTTVPTETTTEETTTTTPAPLVPLDDEELRRYADKYDNVAGWIYVPGTEVNYVVVQPNRSDFADESGQLTSNPNDFYKNHDYAGSWYSAGAIFADYRCVVNDYSFNQSDNILLYGHSMAYGYKDGTMFATLKYYRNDLGFYTKHPTFQFSNLYEQYTYKIIACFSVETQPETSGEYHVMDGYFDYQNYYRFTGDTYNYDNFIKNIMERSEIDTGVDVQEGDKFMTLSTCLSGYEGTPWRYIIVGRRVREGESAEVDTSLARPK